MCKRLTNRKKSDTLCDMNAHIIFTGLTTKKAKKDKKLDFSGLVRHACL